ncbi:MAG TPA: hypothetical protein VES66_11015 [Terriglobales bacterium]|nr:hypothetical protein [Terriglobales bacterium]
MGVVDLFSKRQKKFRGEVSDVFTYDSIPRELRVQVIAILRDALGRGQAVRHEWPNTSLEVYTSIHNILCREYGSFELADGMDSYEKLMQFLLTVRDVERFLDAVEVSFRVIDKLLLIPDQGTFLGSRIGAKEAKEELNERFRWHGVGYQLVSGEVIRVDSQFLHSEAVKPTLALLQDRRYAGANAEFLKAFEHYRHGNTKECLNECLKAFESTMKIICEKRSWAFKPTDTAKALLDACYQNGLVPAPIQSHISSVRASLESGVPTIRNRLGGHGQGATVVELPPHYASYMLHLTATTIQFLIESEKALG